MPCLCDADLCLFNFQAMHQTPLWNKRFVIFLTFKVRIPGSYSWRVPHCARTCPTTIKPFLQMVKLWKLHCVSSGMASAAEQNTRQWQLNVLSVQAEMASPPPQCVPLTSGVEQDWNRGALRVNKEKKAFSTAHIKLWRGRPAGSSRSQSGLGAEFTLCEHVEWAAVCITSYLYGRQQSTLPNR